MKTALAIIVLCFAAIAASAQSVTLAWDEVSDSTVGGYHIYQGSAPRSYTNLVSVAPRSTTTVTFTNLVRGVTYYFAATSVATNMLESDYSAEVSYTVPPLPPVPQNLTIKSYTP